MRRLLFAPLLLLGLMIAQPARSADGRALDRKTAVEATSSLTIVQPDWPADGIALDRKSTVEATASWEFCIYCEFEEVLNYSYPFHEYQITYGDLCGLNYDDDTCQECIDPTNEAQSPSPDSTSSNEGLDEDNSSKRRDGENCEWGTRRILAHWSWEGHICDDHFSCEPPIFEFEAVMARVSEEDIAGLAAMIGESDDRIYYSETAGAVQILGCGNRIAGSYPVAPEVGEALLVELATQYGGQ